MRYYNGNLITASENNTTSNAASGVFDIERQLVAKNAGKWPILPDPTEDFMEISNRFITSTSSSDYTGNFDVAEVEIPAYFSGSARIYLGIKITTQSAFYCDVCIAGVQILNSAGDTLQKSYIFNDYYDVNATWENLGTATAISGSSTQGFPESLATSAARTYGGTITTGNATDRFSLVDGTPSSNTGAADGIGDTFKTSADGGDDTIFSAGNNQVSQSPAQYFMYVEASNVSPNEGFVCRSEAYNFSGGEKIRIAHLLVGYQFDQMDPDDTLYLGVA
jgi:hypothetical protein